ncbi:MAG: 4-hydroxy-tetrahydrodipicolinate reductase [Reyranellaceae bacterium]
MKICIVGAGGRMGQMLVRQIASHPDCTLGAATERAGSNLLGRDAGELAGVGRLDVPITDDAAAAIARCAAVIDFTAPAASVRHAEMAAAAGAVVVLGTTGLDAEQDAIVAEAAKRVPIVKSGNMSLGVNLLTALVARVAAALDDSYDIEIVEMHHRHKVDAPSGTALMLGQAAADGRKVSLADKAARGRDGHTGARRTGDIGFAALRGGDVVGDHTVIFAGPGERLELTHKAATREIFANGALRAALWGRGKPPGLYSMHDVLGLTG